MIGALTAPTGWRVWLLWTLCVAFSLATMGWLFPPSQSPFLLGTMAVFAAFVRGGAGLMLVTIAVVAMIVRQQAPPPTLGVSQGDNVDVPTATAGYAVTDGVSKWVPDMTLAAAVTYLEQGSRWRRGRRYLTTAEVVDEIREALRYGKVTAWGRPHPDDDEIEIAKNAWRGADITADTSYAFFAVYQEAAHAVRLSQGQLEAAYPPS